jgi:Aromatic acid exporter family member 1
VPHFGPWSPLLTLPSDSLAVDALTRDDLGVLRRLRHGWSVLEERVAWTPPTRAEIGSVARAGLAAALAWVLAVAVTDVEAPVLAPLAALITVRVSVHASIRSAIERSAAVVLGVMVAIAIGNHLGLNVLTVGLLTSGSLAFALLVLRLPRPAANQIPVSALVVMAALAAGEESYAWERALDTVLGAAVGVAVSLALPASRRNDARESMRRLATVMGDELEAMGDGLCVTWSTSQTAEWRHTARTTRQRLVEQMTEAVGKGRDAAQWNIRDRPHVAELGRYEDVMPRLERTAIGVWAIARGLDDHAQLTGGEHRPMEAMGALLVSLGNLVRDFTGEVVGDNPRGGVAGALQEVFARRAPCARAAHRQTLEVRDDEPGSPGERRAEWMSYTALLVQIDRIVDDLRAPLPT